MPAQPSVRPFLAGIGADPRSDVALAAAFALARALGAPVRALHAMAPVPYFPGAPELAPTPPVHGPEVVATLRARLEARLARTVKDAGAGVDFQLDVREGRPASLLLETARALDAEIVFLGPHARRGVIDFGTTARAILAGAPCAVWQQPAAPAPLRRVIAAVDLSDQSEFVLAAARDLCRALKAKLTVAFVFQPPDPALLAVDEAALPVTWDVLALRRQAKAEFDALLARFDWRGLAHDDAFLEGVPSDALLARAPETDLIVMGTHGRGRLSTLVLGSVAYSVLRSCPKPVLALRHPERATFA